MCLNVLDVIKDEDTDLTVIYLWAQVDFIVEITYPKIRVTKLQEQLLKLTTPNWVQYYIFDNHKFINFLNHMYEAQKTEKIT